jgi:phage baseplate assembly protein W
MNHRTDIAVPYSFDARGHTRSTRRDQHIRDLIEAVLFTTPGERPNRPDFGCGLIDAVFQGNSDALATTTELTVQASLQRLLGDLIEVHRVAVTAVEGTLTVEVDYLIRADHEPRAARFEMEV